MEELELLDTPVIEMLDLGQLLLRFAFNTIITWFIIHFLYYPKSRRGDYYFTFTLIAISIFFLIYLLAGVKLKVGFALGLFAIFGIIRYRTESMPVREMTYLFVLIAISVINALGVTLSLVELGVTNLIFIIAIWLCENSYKWMKHVECKYVMYDKIDLIKPEKEEELKADIIERTGLNVLKVEVGGIDFLKDTAMLKVYYDAGKTHASTVDRMLKMPKEDL